MTFPTPVQMFDGFSEASVVAIATQLPTVKTNFQATNSFDYLEAHLIEALQYHDTAFPNGANNFVVSATKYNLSTEVQRTTYTVIIDRNITTTTAIEPVPITP